MPISLYKRESKDYNLLEQNRRALGDDIEKELSHPFGKLQRWHVKLAFESSRELRGGDYRGESLVTKKRCATLEDRGGA